MGDVINLRLVRKQSERRGRDETAKENRIAFGRTKSERKHGEAQAKLERDKHEAHRLSGDKAPDDAP
jgi:Domain of unknown function (DUF4169)